MKLNNDDIISRINDICEEITKASNQPLSPTDDRVLDMLILLSFDIYDSSKE